MEDIFDQNVSDVRVGAKELEILKTNLQKDGFRSGLSLGQEKEIQTGFNQAFSTATVSLQKVSNVRGQICAHLSMNHIYSGDQSLVSEEVQSQLEDLLQTVLTFEHTCMETSDNLLNTEQITEFEEEIQKKVQEFQSQLQQILSTR